MAEFPVNPTRFDPYKNYKFRVKWDGHYIPGISAVGPLRRTTEIVEHREGGDLSRFRRSPGLTRYDPITLQRGVTQDSAFENWANLVWKLGAPLGGESALAGLRKDVHIELLNEAGQVVLAYIVHRAWVPSTPRFPTSTPEPRPSRSNRSPWRMKAGSGTPASPNRWNRRTIDPINSHLRELFLDHTGRRSD